MIQTLLFILAPLTPIQDDAAIQSLIRALGDDDAATRDEAMAALQKQIARALPALRKAAKTEEDPEARSRIERLVRDASAGALLWKQDGSVRVRMLAEDRVVLNRDRALLGLDPDSGGELWRVDTRNLSMGPVSGGIGFARSGPKCEKLSSIDLSTGKILWEHLGKDWVWPEAAAGKVFLYDRGGDSSCLDARTGKAEWTVPRERLTLPVIVEGKRVFVLGANRTVRALSLATGEELWRAAPGGTHLSLIGAAGGSVFVRGGDVNQGTFRAYDLGTGRERWTREVKGEFAPGQLTAGLLFLQEGGQVRAIDPSDGSALWTVAAHGFPVVVCGPQAFVGAGKGIRALDLRTGRELWTSTKAEVPLGEGGTEVYACRENRLVALAAGTGDVKWTFEAASGIRSASRAGRRIYVTSFDFEITPPEMSRAPMELNAALICLRAAAMDERQPQDR